MRAQRSMCEYTSNFREMPLLGAGVQPRTAALRSQLLLRPASLHVPRGIDRQLAESFREANRPFTRCASHGQQLQQFCPSSGVLTCSHGITRSSQRLAAIPGAKSSYTEADDLQPLLTCCDTGAFRCMKHSWNMAEAFGPFTRHEQRHASETRFSCKSLLCLTGTWQLTAFFSGGRLQS